MDCNASTTRRYVADFTLPKQIKTIDSGRFAPVNLEEMLLKGDCGDWKMRLINLSERLTADTARSFHYTVLHALNGKRKVSTVRRWANEFELFTRSVFREKDPLIEIFSLEMFNRYTLTKGASQNKLLRSILLYWKKLKVRGISNDLADYLESSKSPKPRHTSEIQNTNPKERPFSIGDTRAILARIDELYICGTFDPQDNLLWRLIVSLALRPTQLRLLWICDVRYEIDDTTGKVHAFLNIPIVKQHGTPARAYMLEYRMSDAITAAIQQYFAFIEKIRKYPPEPTQPLFSVTQSADPLSDIIGSEAISISRKIELTRSLITDTLPDFDNSDLFTRRFKHTKLTHLAILGAPLEVLARAGYQTSTISLKHYVNLSEEAYADYEKRLEAPNQEIHNAFKGRIVESSDATNNDPHHAILSPDLEDTLGDCAETPCGVFAPVGCYVCPRFEAFTDGDHSSVLQLLERKVVAAKRLNLSDESIERDAHLISAVKFVIEKIKENASLS